MQQIKTSSQFEITRFIKSIDSQISEDREFLAKIRKLRETIKKGINYDKNSI